MDDASSPGDAARCAPVPAVPLGAGAAFGATLDDMTTQESQTGGSWYSYSSRSVPNSEPPILTTDAGVLVPLEGASFPPNNGAGCVPPLLVDGAAAGYRELSGDSIPSWGAGFGLDIVSGVPDGGPVAINACDAGAIFDPGSDAGAVGIPQPFDAAGHGFTGFSFWGISLGTKSVSVEVHVDDADTTPWGGRFCDPCRSSGKCTGSADDGTLDCPCSDNFVETVTFQPGQWTQFAVRWADPKFTANHWSNEGPLTFDATHVYNIHFQFTTSSGVKTPSFDLAVSDLVWLTN